MKTPAQSEGQTSKACLELVPQENELKTPMFSERSPKWDILIHIHVSVPQELNFRGAISTDILHGNYRQP